MADQIRTVADANKLLISEIRRREAALAKGQRPSGRDEAVVCAASWRDRTKFIPRRMN